MKSRITIVALVAVFALVGMLSLNASDKKSSEEAGKSVKAADFELMDLNQKNISLSDFTGKVIILDFWATWCPPCVKEIPHFNELAKEYGEKGLVVIGVSVDRDGASAVNKFVKKTPINYPVLFSTTEVYEKYQSYLPMNERGGIPFTFIIDRDGQIRNQYVGYRPKEVFESAIKPLL